MIKHLPTNIALFLSFLFLIFALKLEAQQTVFTEDFNAPGTPQNSAFTTNGSIGTSRWNVTRSGNDFGAKIDGGFLTLTNDVSSGGNSKGWVLASTPTSNFSPSYNPILSQNPGIVSWTFNMRQIRTNPAGLTNGNYGVGYILAGTAGSTNAAGKGYAIMLGQPYSKDPIRLATYNNGIATYYTKLNSNTSGLSDFGREYTSIRVEYNPATSEWSLYVRKDNSTSFNDPKSGSLVYQGKIINSEFVNESLPMTGAYWSAATGSKQTAFFDNISVDVVVPEIIAIDPDSKIANSGAFTLTVDGKGFTSASKVYWNGLLKNTTFVSATKLTAAIPATDITLPVIVPITVKNGTYESNAVPFEVEPSGVPALTLSKNTLPFISTTMGIASAATETYTIKGIDLIADATITAPANFEISVNNGTYADMITLPISAGILTGQPLSLKARLKASASAGNFTGNITHTTTGAVTKQVAVSGRVLDTEPTGNATAISFSNITSTGFKLNWSNGSGEQRLVLIREASAVNALPTDAITYGASSVFANGAEIGTGNYVVYKGTGNNVQITALQSNTTYHVSIIEFNGSVGTENYRVNGLTGDTKTLNSPAGLQLKAANTSYKIDFDNTVDGVNLETFQGAGIAKIAEVGQLDSDSWAFSGFSGGNIAFGGDSVEDSSYENGPSEGNEVDTGMYAFNVGTTESENYTIGIQPGGTDFNPGTITLKIQNQSAATMTSINIGYKVYVYNDQPSSSKISFSYGTTATGTYTSQPIADVISPTTADLAPGWKAYYRSVTIPTVSIAKDAYYYIRWSGSLASGSGAQDEFAIDDIEVIANPAANNSVSFDGIAEDFVLQGNASLSADLSVQNKLLFNGGKLAIKDKTLTIAGSVTNTTANGLIGGTNSNLIVRGTKNPLLSFDQTIVGTNVLQNFSLIGANANMVTITNPLQVNQLLAIDEQQVLNLGTISLLGTLNSIINNGLIQTQNTTATPFTSGKTWNGTGILNLNATSAAQTLVAGTYNNLTLSSTTGTTAVSNATVNGILNLPMGNASSTKGSLDMATYTLVMGPEGTNIGVGDVTGIIRRNSFTTNKLYTFGHPNSSITFPPAGTLPDTMSAKLTLGEAPTWRTGAIKRQFDIIQTGAVDTKAIIRQHYLDSELNTNVESKLVFWANKIGAPTPVFDQGRSNNSTTENWVEISNANVGLYFTNTFDQVYISLDETSGSDLVWNGSTSTSWVTAANWTPAGVPSASTKVFIPNVSTTSNRSPIIDVTSSVKTITIEAGGIVNTPITAQLTVSGGAGAWQNNGIFNPTNGTVIFNNLDATISGSTTFSNLTIAAAGGLRALEGNYMSIAGAWTNNGTMFTTLIPNTIEFIGSGQTIPNVNGLDFGGYHNLIVSGEGTSLASTITTLNVRGNLILNQPLSFAGKTINMTGVADQTIGGTAAINFNNLIVNKETAAVILANDISVDGTLTLTKGNLILGDKNLSLGSNAVSGTFGTDTMIVTDGTGLVTRKFTNAGSYLFPIGELTGAPSYSPINVALTEGTFAANAFVGVNVVDAKHPKNFSSQDFISRYWNVIQNGITNAVANITGTYDPLDFNGEESAIAAAQLKGTFDLANNPWTKFASLANNTLFAEGAMLNSGQNSVFTGIKGGALSVEVYGYGDFCLDSDVQIEAVVNNGDAPFTYLWSNGLPNSAMVTIPTNAVGTTSYTLTVIDANGLRATDNNIPIDIFPQTVGGTISNDAQIICAGSQLNDLELLGSVGKVLYWQSSTDINFVIDTENTNNVTNISNFTTTLSGNKIGAINQTTYFRAVLQNGDCAEKFSSIATITIKSTIWNGTTWSAGKPDSVTSAIFEADYTDPSDFTACSILVESGKTFKIRSGKSMTIQNDIINKGNIVVESDGNLIQVNNTGTYSADPLATFTVNRDANIKRLDYVYWSSPVSDQKLKSFSSGTLNNRFLTYNEWDDKFTAVPNVNANFIPAKGYAIRASNTQSGNLTDWPGKFVGIPNNGIHSFKLAFTRNGYNLVGNPYPSNITLEGNDGLFNINQGVIAPIAYFWNNINPNGIALGQDYNGANYAVYNKAGGTPAANSTIKSDGIVKLGQGFIVQALHTSDQKDLVFDNVSRTATPTSFYDKKNQVIDRFWLQLTTPNQDFNTLLIAYLPDATNGYELGFDAPLMNLSSDAFYSSQEQQNLSIQGRKYPLNLADIVLLGSNSYTAGEHIISIQAKEGIFANGQNIYLKDKQTNLLINLSTGDYRFTANAGLTEGRFEIVYENDNILGANSIKKEEVIVYRDGTDFIVKSAKIKISDVEVYDTSGRLIIKLNPNQTEIRIDGRTMINGVYVLKVNQNGKITTRKIIR